MQIVYVGGCSVVSRCKGGGMVKSRAKACVHKDFLRAFDRSSAPVEHLRFFRKGPGHL